MSNHNAGHDFMDLSDADINILYDIALLASQQPAPSFGPGLFAAYDEIIARDNISSDDSPKFFAFVCRMVSGRKNDEGVMERLVVMLADVGIEVSPIEDDSTGDVEEHGQLGQVNGHALSGNGSGQPDQLNGVLSQAETLAEEEEVAKSPLESGFGIKTGLQAPPRRKGAPDRGRSRSQETNTRTFGLNKGRLNGRVASDDHLQTRPRRTVSVSSNRSVQVSQPHEPHFGAGDAYSADESDAFSPPVSRRHSMFDAADGVAQDPHRFLPPGIFQRSQEEMEEEADAFQHTKAVVAQRRILREWRHKAVNLQRAHEHLNTIAENFDHGKLIRDTLVVWREKLDARRLDKEWEENESFYKMIEDSAVSERHRNLQWVAFTHWDQMAKDERQRTSTARRHVIRLRYFNAWNSITAVNNLKVRRHVLRKFFGIWQQRLEQIENHKVRALAVHENNVTKNYYWRWWHAFANKLSPQWHGKRRLREVFHRWRDIARQLRERDHEVEQMRQRDVQRKWLQAWTARKQTLIDLDIMAENFRNTKALSRCISKWQKDAVLAPKATQIIQQRDMRIQRTVLTVWNQYAQLSREATRVRDLRVVRNAFTKWNDALRIRFLENQMDVRVKAEALYKWTLAFRDSVATRDQNRTIAAKWLHHWASKAQTQHQTLESAERTFIAARTRRTLRTALAKLTSAVQQERNLAAEAQVFRNTRLATQALSKWRAEIVSVQQLNIKANAAEFYILTTRSLNKWKEATSKHLRLRKRDAYAQVRRQNKMNLAREMLRRMQDRLALVRNMERISEEWEEDHVVRVAVSTFTTWKSKSASCAEHARQAEDVYNRKVLRMALRKLNQKSEGLKQMERQAREFAAGWQAVDAMNCLRRMDRRLFQVKGQEQWALALKEKHWEKHVKNMLRYWAERVVTARRELNDVGDPHRGVNHGGDDEHMHGGLNPRTDVPAAGDLSVFENSAWNLGPLDLDLHSFPEGAQPGGDAMFFENEGIITSTPLPGYLRTPSKRNTARAKARERLTGLAGNPPPTSSRGIRFADQLPAPPATAPPRQQSSIAPPALSAPAGRGITSFERKLREQGYTQTRFGSRTPVSGALGNSGPSRFGFTPGARINTPGRSGFAGFEDIAEVSSERTQ